MEIKISAADLQKRSIFVATPMYGGMCAGMFTRSVADLSVLCAKYNINLKMFFLFNESLIQRGRNYCADEFLRSDCTHLLFLDGDIGFNANDAIAMLALQGDDSEYDVLTAPYPKKSYHPKTKIITEDGIKTISKIVNDRYSGNVLSYSDVNGFEFKPVIGHFKTLANGKRWVKLVGSKDNYGTLTVTHDHEVATVADLFNPSVSYLPAELMQHKPIVRQPKTGNGIHNENVLYSKEQLQLLIGTLLGDSTIRKNGQITVSHSTKNRDLAELKANLFDLNQKDVKIKLKSNDKEYAAISLWGGSNLQTKELRKLLYVDGKKSLAAIVDKIDISALAMLYMDDGYLSTHNDISYLCTEGFSDNDIGLLQHHLLNVFGLTTSTELAGNKAGLRLRFHVDSTKKLHELIAPYVITEQEYKLLPEYRGGEKFDYTQVKRLNFTAQLIKQVLTLEDSFDQYDITVADNFNIVTAERNLAHNCISWEKIKLAVDKGFADQDPSVLERFVGDYVFNPVPTMSEIPLNRPVEVLEAGTGFMMIRRKTFEVFNEKYPEQRYLPDHVRTEHFDGSREITAFFDCIIDPATKRYLSEDYMFCQYVRNAGMKVWLCPWIQTQHVGSYIFGGSLPDLAAIGAAATADVSALKKKKVAL